MDSYFTRISEVIEKRKICPRVKFLLQDILELRSNMWIPRQCRYQADHENVDKKEKRWDTSKQRKRREKFNPQQLQVFRGKSNYSRVGEKESSYTCKDKRDRDRLRDRGGERDRPKEKLDARMLQVFLKLREKSKLSSTVSELDSQPVTNST